MRLEQTRWQDAPLRLARVSFTGDLSYEVSVPVSRAEALWNTLLPVVRREGGDLLGIEALSVLRAEKGYVMVGKDTDGETMPQDLGFDGPRWKKSRRFLAIAACTRQRPTHPIASGWSD